MELLCFEDVLKKAGLNPQKVKLIRHSKGHENFKKCYDNNQIFEYTCCQTPDFSKNYDYWAVFISEVGTYARFFALYKVNGSVPDTPDLKPEGFPIEKWFRGEEAYFNLQPINLLQEYEGRMVIDWGKSTLMWHQKGTTTKPIVAIAAEQVAFPGFENVVLSYDELKEVVDNKLNYEGWHTALSSINAVYLIVDKENGRQYVGSAYGESGLLQRWKEYVETKHGNNKRMEELLYMKPESYQNFQFTILQILSQTITPTEVQRVENLWKKKLVTKNSDFGLNAN